MDLELNGKRALVLGASRGLGMAIAKSLAAEGATVFAAARSRDKIADWAQGMSNVTPLALDLADIGQVDSVVDDLLKDGGVDIIVNNGGGPPPGTAQTAERGQWLTHFEAMAANLFHLNTRLLPAMKRREWGRIISITSSGVEQPIPNLALSNGIRSAVVGWSKTLANEVAGDGITVNVVMPGRIHTQRVDELDAAAAKRTETDVTEVAAKSRATIPAGRYGKPEEFADVVTFLASARAGYVTGSKIRIDGGSIKSI
ncbi:SDR family oxidoreductase [Sulfitobacter mediterraneus]|uniref:SDR family oxidoreductase n=1 Tax=Sulfitobacter mediterraneus TaxID=83219 RepID=UPI001931F63A|nr:SDR family oxidoreductase [Sulfitobacter mediterraneus]MBM1634555.1 SDR family oxidoreductase [Sulfitobacter mediterraneus]MBM1642373.1 SDR family oxidoreductase [Sulfitobacter mediterraneus]MBM1646421.1 SDR family oxidoreductase [Sulfitobacter mediterraneus]MBM1650467.1 SDR family oxidoreductase [Sulfitobacter mediterraneus]MBM1654489.1 SDR family oxidoreductase [Sulfitobacter mediterraneus]